MPLPGLMPVNVKKIQSVLDDDIHKQIAHLMCVHTVHLNMPRSNVLWFTDIVQNVLCSDSGRN